MQKYHSAEPPRHCANAIYTFAFSGERLTGLHTVRARAAVIIYCIASIQVTPGVMGVFSLT
jgi:hypothetical protein